MVDKKLKRNSTENRIRFTESWLSENPQGIEPTKTFGSIKFNIKDLLNVGVTPLKTIDPSVFKIDLSNKRGLTKRGRTPSEGMTAGMPKDRQND